MAWKVESMEELGPSVLFRIFGLPLTNTVVMSWLLILFLGFLSFLVTRRLQEVPGGLQNFVEAALELLQGMVEETMGPRGKTYFPLIGTLFLFILLGNWMGTIPGLSSPTADLNVTLGLALVVFFANHACGLRERGFSYFRHFLEPSPLFLPFNLIEEVTRPVSLSFRLFGNITGEHIVVAVLAMIVPYLVPVPMSLFGLFTGFIQALVFTMLAMTYLAQAVD